MRMILQYFIIIALLLVTYWLLPIFKPFLAGAFFAAILLKPTHFIQRKTSISRSLAVLLSLFLMVALFFSAITIFCLIGARTISHIHDVVPIYAPIAVAHAEQIISEITAVLTPDQKIALVQFIESLGSTAEKTAEMYAGDWILSGTVLLLAIPGTAAEILIALLAAFFIAKDGDLFLKAIPVHLHEKAQNAAAEFSASFYSYTRAQIHLFAFTFFAACTGFFLLRTPHLIELAFLTAVLEFVPVIGSSLLFVPWILFCLLTGQVKIAVFVAILYIALMIMRQLLEPKLVSDSAGLHPLAVLFSAFAGYHLLGVFGVMIGPLFLLVCLSVYRSGLLITKR